jgi:GDPmannose 4,6-dehydratase
MSHVHVSFEEPEYTANADGIGTLRILEAVRLLGLIKKSSRALHILPKNNQILKI